MNKVTELIKNAKTVAILPHENADGDAIGSCLAMREALRDMGKKAEIYAEETLETALQFIDDGIIIYSDQAARCDTCIVLDCGAEKRIGKRAAIAESADYVINIDHHRTNTHFGDAAYVEPEASATGEILFKIFKNMNIEITKNIAKYLYTAICSDTGCFAYSNVSPETFRIAAELVAYDIDHAEIARQLFNCVELSLEFLKAELTSSIRSYYGGKLRVVTADKSITEKYDVDPHDLGDLVDLPRRIRGTEAAVAIKYADGKIRASIRSNGAVDVALIALEFGGGGHTKAAGCTINAPSVDEAEKLIVEAFGAVFE